MATEEHVEELLKLDATEKRITMVFEGNFGEVLRLTMPTACAVRLHHAIEVALPSECVRD